MASFGAPFEAGGDILRPSTMPRLSKSQDCYIIPPKSKQSAGGIRCNISTHHAANKYAAAGLIRERHVLAATRGSEIVGYSLLDYSSLGINYSFLFNAFTLQMYREDPAIERDLAAASVNHYLARGRSTVVALSAGGNEESFEQNGLELRKKYAELTIARAGCFSVNVDHFSNFYNRVGEK
ncbi:hypothetical protein ACFL2Q_16400 [Thermodesulfobacteriota bacterium]